MLKENIVLEYVQPEAGFLLCGSSHSQWELIFVHAGQLHAVVEGFHLPLSQGQMVLCAPEQFHMLYAQEGQTAAYLRVCFDAQGFHAHSLTGKALDPGSVSPALERMVAEYTQPDPYAQSAVFHLLGLILLQLCRTAPALPAESPRRPQQGENGIIRRAQQYIAGHIREKLSVTLVAQRIDVSPSYLTALFHKHLAIAPGEYIRRAKLQESKALIQEGSLNFTQIASALEYSTVHHFSRQFKEHFGMTPTEYAKHLGKKGI